MRFYTETECREWCAEQKVSLDDEGQPERNFAQPHRLRCAFPPKFSQLLWFSRCIESCLQPRQDCLLWVTAAGIFPSNENNHLYYRIRQSYGDGRLLHESPGHLCLDYEKPEVVTLIYLCISFGWDVHLIPSVGYARALISHDEWVEIGFDDPSEFEDTKKALKGAKIGFSANDAT